MAKTKATTQYVCSDCGHSQPKFSGKCPECNAWNTMAEVRISAAATKSKGNHRSWTGQTGQAATLDQAGNKGPVQRLPTTVGEFDRALGGGLVPGSVALLGGDPGIGKSTLLLQTLAGMGHAGAKVLYVTGEESIDQVADRARRLGLPLKSVHTLAETDSDAILATMDELRPHVVVIDSIQTIQSPHLESAPGTVSQVRECAVALTRYAKQNGCGVFLIGHVTKEGTVAGPRVLEHLVDAVLYFEGDPQSPYRLVRAIKNRFGAANELGAFEMTEKGLLSIDNPSAMFLADDRQNASGACVFVLQDGPRPLLVEIQALMDETTAANPRRLGVGIDTNRLSMLLAVLHKHGGADIMNFDVFVNAVGGLKAMEPAADLPMVLSLLSSMRDRVLPTSLACFGEVGLTGEVRPVQHGADRIREAASRGFTDVIVPKRNAPDKPVPGIKVHAVRTLAEAIMVMSELSTGRAAPSAR